MEEKEVLKTENTTSEKKSLIEWCKEHPKTTFIIRAVLWASFACLLPFIFIADRYGIFRNDNALPQLSGWGFIAIIILAVFLITLVRYILAGLKKGFLHQCIIGFVAVIIPLLAVYLIVDIAQRNLECFKTALGCTIICEMIAIPINPFPAWIEKQKEKEKKESGDK